MPRPRIGISLDTGAPDEARKMYELNADYPNAIYRAGGLPVLLPHTDNPALQQEIFDSLDGLLIPGGADCDPSLYHATRHPSSCPMDPLRQSFDLALLKLADEKNLPTLGICLGHQLLNVHRGGSLHQNIGEAFPESPIRHAKISAAPGYNSAFHSVTLRPGTKLMSIYEQQSLDANSRHRQAVDRLGKNLIATAFSEDGILEGLEDPSKLFFLGVQWHPENLAETTCHQKLFNALVNAAANVPHP